MAHAKYHVKPKEWWKHMRWMRRPQEKKVRQQGNRTCKEL